MLAISCALTDPQDIAWWQPYATSTSEHPSSTAEQPWLPWAVQITVDVNERKVSVAEGSSATELQMQDSSTPREQARIRWAMRPSKAEQGRCSTLAAGQAAGPTTSGGIAGPEYVWRFIFVVAAGSDFECFWQPCTASTYLLLILACQLLYCTCPVFCRAVYEMTAMVCHVMDTDATGAGEEKPEGHLVAHVKVGQFAAVLVQDIMSQTCGFNMYLDQELTQGSLLSRYSTAPVARVCTHSNSL